jgi:uncharacterized protein YndB with AHSA1/START domain
MPTVRLTRAVAAPADELWAVVSDPHHLPRWWPRVARVEGVHDDEFTEVMISPRGRPVRADFRIVRASPAERTLVWEQLLQDSPFARVLRSAEVELSLADAAGEPGRTDVTIELRQELGSRTAGPFGRMVNMPRLGAMLVRRAARATAEEALDGLERISGD